MLPFLNMRIYNRSNYLALQPFIERMKTGQLTIENILEEDEIIQDLKTSPNSQFLYMINNETIRKLIDYATKMPASDDKKVGHKFPFNATELLCCDNSKIIEHLMNEVPFKEENEEVKKEEEKKEDEKKDEEEKKEEKKEEKEEGKEEEKKEEQKEEKGEEKKEEQKEEKKEEEKKESEEPKPKEEDKKDEEIKKEENVDDKKEKEPEKQEEVKNKEEQPKKEVTEEKTENPKEEVKKEEAQNDEEKKEGEDTKKEEPKTEESNENKEKEEEKPQQEQEQPQKEEEEKEEEDDNSKKEDEDNSEKEQDDSNSIKIYDNIDYLLNFLNSPEETKRNYVLVGYFYKILNHLFNSQSTKIIRYFFEYPNSKEFDVLDLLVKNMRRKSMGDIINKLLLFNEENYGDFVQQKKELLLRVLEELKVTKEEEKYECICRTLEAAFYNKAFVIEFMKDQKFIELLYNILEESKEETKKSIAIMKLLIKINENILKNIEGRCTTPLEQENPMDIINMFSNNYISADELTVDPDAKMEDLTKNLIVYSFDCFEKNKFSFIEDLDNLTEKDNSEFNTTYQKPQKKLGMKKLTQIELFRTILDIIVNAFAKCSLENESNKVIDIIKEKKIFSKINKLFFEFPFCNLYQAIYIQIIDIITNEWTPESLVKAVFDEKDENGKNLIQIYIDNSSNNLKFSFNSDRKTFNPNFSIEVMLLSKIVLSSNEYINNLIKENKNLEVFHNVLGDEVNNIFEQKLLLEENDIRFGSQEETETKKPSVYFGSKDYMTLVEEDLNIYKVFLEGGDYQKLLDEKKEKTKKEQEEKEKEMLEEQKKSEDDEYFGEEDEEKDKKNKKQDEEDNRDDEENKEEENNEKKEEKDEEGKKDEKEKEEQTNQEEKSTSEESAKDKVYNDVNFWKTEIMPTDEIMNAIMNDLE